jgi:endonuclease/exonuclease/phosphatase family metal-dependent hydrolase
VRIASYNVENLFNRARALDQRTWAAGRPVLESYQRICQLLEEPVYYTEIQQDILSELAKLGLLRGDTAKFARLRQNRGRLLKRPRNKPVEVIAAGRSDWIGWVELTTDRVDEIGLWHTARVLDDLAADVVGVIEAESRVALKRFADAALRVEPRAPSPGSQQPSARQATQAQQPAQARQPTPAQRASPSGELATPGPQDQASRQEPSLAQQSAPAQHAGPPEELAPAQQANAVRQPVSAARPVQVPRYPHVMVIDGNDERGIDVGVLSTLDHPIVAQHSHVDDTDDVGRVFSRDCAEYHVRTAAGNRVAVLVNHFKSKGYGGKVASDAIRRRQAQRVADIYRDLIAAGVTNVAIVGDLNDTPDSEPLQPLLAGTDLRDISTHPEFDDGGRPGTYGYCTARNKLDYVLLSPDLYDRATGGGILRRGVWGGRRGTLWPIYETMTEAVHAGSDHAAIYADIALP